jgi:3-oxoadipate enol-lactonase
MKTRHLGMIAAIAAFGVMSEATAQPRMIDVGDAEIRYDVTGSGRVVVFVHGWAQSLTIWDDQVRALSPRYRVVRFDRRGFGRSTGFADPSADPADLRTLLDSLGIRSASVIGLSAGAAAALRFAVAFPDRVDALVLYGGTPPDGFPVPWPGPMPLVAFAQIARDYGVDSLRKAVVASPLAWVPPGKADVRERIGREMADYTGRDLLDPRPPSGRVPPARWDQLASFRVPTLIVNGDHELPYLILVADSLSRRIANVRRVVITDGGHGAHFAQPERFNRVLADFLATIPEARRE